MPSIALTCRICNMPMKRSPGSKPQGEAAHRKCQPAAAETHSVTGYRHGCRCGICREGQRVAVSTYAAKVKAHDGITPSARLRRQKRGEDAVTNPPCTVCGIALDSGHRGAKKPMHSACRSKVSTWRREGMESPKVQAIRRRIEKAARGTTGGKRVFTSGNCPWCSKQFTRANAKWCSTQCKDGARFAMRNVTAFRIAPAIRLAIYKRDAWTCQLCAQPVDSQLHYLDNWAASLDHIVPQSHQLIPDHSPEALRLAHRWCNSARGDGTNMDEKVLVRRAHQSLLPAS